jgi:hypothetical protein
VFKFNWSVRSVWADEERLMMETEQKAVL